MPLNNPLVSCIMPTRDRASFVARSLKYFQDQDYPNRELIIVYEKPGDLPASITGNIHNDTREPNDSGGRAGRIRLVKTVSGTSIGYKRNRACTEASGDIIIHWDDDDWMAPGWISCQASHLIHQQADITGLTTPYFCNAEQKRAWQYIYPVNEKPWVLGGSLCYTRSFWQRNPFQEINIGEDSGFVWSDVPKRIVPHQHTGLYVAMVHDRNTSPKFTFDPRWRPVPYEKIRALLPVEMTTPAAPDSLSTGPAIRQSDPDRWVSCVMPTYNRPHFVRQAILCFLRQSYERSELIVVDDGEPAIEDLCAGLFRVRYIRLNKRTTLGEKLNEGIRQAGGSIIQKWDDDDYYHPGFLEKSVNTLTSTPPGRNLVAWHRFPVLVLPSLKLHASGAGWAAGGTFCFYRRLWEDVPFRNAPSSVDSYFIEDSRPNIIRVDAPDLYMLVRHSQNTWNHLSDGSTKVNRYFDSRPPYSRSLEDIVEPVDLHFYHQLSAKESLS